MNEPKNKSNDSTDLVLKEVWRIKDRLSASYGHDLKKLLAITREHEALSDHPIVSFENDYTATRHELFKGETLESLVAEMKAMETDPQKKSA